MSDLRWFLPAAALLAGPVAAQAPALTELWRVAGTTVPTPSALATGAGGVFWNPAALANDPPTRAGTIEVLQTPDVLALSGFLAAGQWRLSRHLVAGVLLGRMAVSDLVRTTTSPVALPGDIPVHSQVAGLAVGWNGGPLVVGALARLHDSRIDVRQETGVTTDVGVRWRPIAPVVVAATTRFLAPTLERGPSTDLNAGLEGSLPLGRLWGTPARGTASVGVTWDHTNHREFAVGAGLALNDLLGLAWGFGRERSFEALAWRHTLGLTFRTSHYTITVARGEGLNGVGATYRVGLAAGSDQ